MKCIQCASVNCGVNSSDKLLGRKAILFVSQAVTQLDLAVTAAQVHAKALKIMLKQLRPFLKMS